MQITNTRRQPHTVEVYVDTESTYTGRRTRHGRRLATVYPTIYRIDDRDGWGDPNSDVTLIGDIAKKDGTRVRSSAHLDIANADIPDDVWNALGAMRPDLSR